MLGVYEFELFEDDGFVCAFPFDMEGGTQGRDWREAAEMAADWLKGELERMLMSGQEPPEATFGHLPEHEGGRVAIVAVEADLSKVDAVSAARAAEMLGVSRPRVSQMLKSGQLEGWREGRDTMVTLDSVAARLAERPKAGRPKAEPVAM